MTFVAKASALLLILSSFTLFSPNHAHPISEAPASPPCHHPPAHSPDYHHPGHPPIHAPVHGPSKPPSHPPAFPPPHYPPSHPGHPPTHAPVYPPHSHGPSKPPSHPPAFPPPHDPPSHPDHPPAHAPVYPPHSHGPSKPPSHPPAFPPPHYPPSHPHQPSHPLPPIAHPPSLPPKKLPPRSFVAVQGVVYCKSCKYAGVDTLWGATPVSGATVKLVCTNTKYHPLVQTATTDKNGYFFVTAPTTITSFAFHKCSVFLASSPLASCKKPSLLNGGLNGGALRPEKSYYDAQKRPYVLYSVGPFAFEPSCPR